MQDDNNELYIYIRSFSRTNRKYYFNGVLIKRKIHRQGKESLQEDNISFRKKINSKFFYIHNEGISYMILLVYSINLVY